MADRTCVVCGVAAGSTKYCSRSCENRAYHRRYRQRNGELQSTRYRRLHGRKPERRRPIVCAWCQRPAEVNNRRARFCSNDCGQAARYALGKQLVPAAPEPRRWVRWREAEQRLRTAAAGSRRKRAIWAAGCCRRCGEPFVCMITNAPPTHCSRPCARSDSKARRRAAERGAFVAPVSRRAVFDRDRWTCRLCGKRVRRKSQAPEPMAPVLDHIVPLAAGPQNGGVHAPWNVQCAHFLCNSVKSAAYEQGALF